MLALLFAALVSAAPPVAEVWAQGECPRSQAVAASNTEMKLEQRQRAECLRKAMDRTLARLLRPLEKSQPGVHAEWKALQEDYLRWVEDVCTSAEEVHWVDLTLGERSIGTGYGLTESVCLQRQFAWRGYSAALWARGEGKALGRVLEPLGEPALKARRRLEEYQARVQHAVGRVSTRNKGLPSRQLSREEWAPYTARLERVAAGPEALARRQCALLPRPPAECVERLADGLWVQLSLSEVLGGTDSAP